MNRDRVIIVAIICMTIIFIASTVSPAGSSGKTGAGFQMETVKTGDVTWACFGRWVENHQRHGSEPTGIGQQ